MEIELAPYCVYSARREHVRANCLQCELLEKFFLRYWGMTLDVVQLFRAETLKRTEREVSEDIARHLQGISLK